MKNSTVINATQFKDRGNNNSSEVGNILCKIIYA